MITGLSVSWWVRPLTGPTSSLSLFVAPSWSRSPALFESFLPYMLGKYPVIFLHFGHFLKFLSKLLNPRASILIFDSDLWLGPTSSTVTSMSSPPGYDGRRCRWRRSFLMRGEFVTHARRSTDSIDWVMEPVKMTNTVNIMSSIFFSGIFFFWLWTGIAQVWFLFDIFHICLG